MSPAAPDFSNFDPARMAEQMMGFWSGLMKPPQPVAPPSPMAAFAQMFGQAPQATAMPGADLFAQAQQMFGQLQQALLPMLTAQNMDPAAIAEQWQKAIGDSALPASLMAPFAAVFSPGFAAEMRGGMDAAPLGLMREHQQRLQAYAQAQIDLQAAMERYTTLLQRVQREAQTGFESRLREHSEPGRQLQSARALFDLWIDAAEEAFAEAALGAEYRHVYGELVNAQMRLRKCSQDLMEQQLKSLGLPSRGELDSSHKRAYEMGRELRALKLRVAELEAGRSAAPAKASRPEVEAPASAPKSPAKPKRAAAPKAGAKSKPKPARSRKAAATKSAPPAERASAANAPAAKASTPAAAANKPEAKPKPKRSTPKRAGAKSAAKSTIKTSARRKALPPLAAVTPKAPPASSRKGK